MHLQSETLLQGGKYRITRFISSGGFGNTYEGVHTMMDTRVAIKEFFPKMFCNRDENTSHVTVATNGNRELVDKLRKKFNEEAKAVFQMNHPNIVRVLDIFEENGTAYYVMEYIDGKSLNEISKERGALPEAEAVGYIKQIADALKYVHSLNRLHLDIKPGNIMVDKTGKVILIDFGASKHYDDESGENTSTLMGVNTKGYAPIEQSTQSFTSFSPATDIYALGATLYKLLTGITPPDANLLLAKEESLQHLPSSVSESTRFAVMSAMSLIRAERLQNVSSFIALLDKESETTILSEPVINTKPPKDSAKDIQIPSHVNGTDISRDWWIKEGLTPVSTWAYFNSWRIRSVILISAFFLCGIVGLAAGAVIDSVLYDDSFYGRGDYDSTIGPVFGTYVGLSLLELLIWIFRNRIFPKRQIKNRSELAESDYIEEYKPDKSSKNRYYIVVRGNIISRKYGVFDLKKLRLSIPFKYGRMQWYESQKILSVQFGDESYYIDLNENKFK